MTQGTHYIISETTEDRFDESDSLEEALRVARDLVKVRQAGDPVSVKHAGRVMRRFVLIPDGEVEKEPVQ